MFIQPFHKFNFLIFLVVVVIFDFCCGLWLWQKPNRQNFAICFNLINYFISRSYFADKNKTSWRHMVHSCLQVIHCTFPCMWNFKCFLLYKIQTNLHNPLHIYLGSRFPAYIWKIIKLHTNLQTLLTFLVVLSYNILFVF